MWLARDRNGMLYVYEKRPIRKDEMFLCSDGDMDVVMWDIPNVTWENSPVEVELKIKEESK